MSTRAVIARTVGDGWKGRYHHWDGYPTGLGKMLFDLNRVKFKGDTAAMMKVLIDDHPAGWSTIDGDWRLSPGFTAHVRAVMPVKERRPQCYCHGDRHEEAHEIKSIDRDYSGAQWVYAINQRDHFMFILEVVSRDGRADTRLIAIVDLNWDEPNWNEIKGRTS